jgi:hypothetical protein
MNHPFIRRVVIRNYKSIAYCNICCVVPHRFAPMAIVISLAWREYETWFVTAAPSLAGHHGLPADLQPPPAPDTIRGAKKWLGQRMANGYDPVTHQLSFSKLFDLGQARTNRSFDRLCRIVEGLLGQPAESVS